MSLFFIMFWHLLCLKNVIKQILNIWTNKVVPQEMVDTFALVYIGHSEVLHSLGRLPNEDFYQEREIQVRSNHQV